MWQITNLVEIVVTLVYVASRPMFHPLNGHSLPGRAIVQGECTVLIVTRCATEALCLSHLFLFKSQIDQLWQRVVSYKRRQLIITL